MPKNHRNYQKTRHIALSGLLFALAMALSFIEGTLVIPGLLPGMKLGLANIVVMYALFFMGPRQALVLGAALAEELAQTGLHNAHMDEYGYVYAWLPATAGCEGIPCVGLIAHMDTSPDAPGAGVKPRVVRYEGGDLVLNEEKGIVMRAAEFESLAKYKGQELIVTDGTTLLGADDKAGVAEIMSAVEYLSLIHI